MPISQKLSQSATTIPDPSHFPRPVNIPTSSVAPEEAKVGAHLFRASLEGGDLLKGVDLPMAMPYVPHRQTTGVSKVLAATLCTLLGLFLVMKAGGPGWLQFDMVVFGSVGMIAGLSFGISAWRDLLGRLEVNERGISAMPFWTGFQVNWSEMEAWKVNKFRSRGELCYQLLLWTRGDHCPLVVPIEWVSSENQTFLLSLLERKVPHRSLMC